jgi:hypothetical protein
MQEAETGRIMVPGQPRGKKILQETPISAEKKLDVMVCTCHPSNGGKLTWAKRGKKGWSHGSSSKAPMEARVKFWVQTTAKREKKKNQKRTISSSRHCSINRNTETVHTGQCLALGGSGEVLSHVLGRTFYLPN